MRRLKGTVTSDKMHHTVTVRVDRREKHAKYFKYRRISRKFKAHDGEGRYRTGDEVRIEETRPLSKEKRWKVVELIKRAGSEEVGVAEGDVVTSTSLNQES